jgi:hypothetical protein
MANNNSERALFEAWLAQPRSGPVTTGWMTWSASLAARGATPGVLAPSRPAFDAWLKSVLETDWHLFDAWLAAAHWLEQVAKR